MKRFLMFPLILGIVGALFLPFYFGESVVAQWPAYTFPTAVTPREKFVFYFIPAALYGLIAGAIFGFVLAIGDLIRNHNDRVDIVRLLSNIFWCSFYGLIFTSANRILIAVMLVINGLISGRDLKPESMLFWWLGALLINFTAIIWAAIRSVTTDDVLTPRVLREKLRRSARLN